MFPTDNPIQSLDEYDSLSNADKAQTLTMLSNFDGKLPRPRVLIRDAEIRQDYDALEQLQSEKSRRQIAKEKAEQARNEGSDDVADWWENEADLYEGLRADITQDEGSYSRFLDKDEWYERDRLARAKRIKKSSFGTLLDGIE
jgi:PAB1-binding protein PBP1